MSDHRTELEHGADGARGSGRGGFVALAVIAAAMGAGAALLFSPDQGAKTRRLVGQGLRNIRGEGARSMRRPRKQRALARKKAFSISRLAAKKFFACRAGITCVQ